MNFKILLTILTLFSFTIGSNAQSVTINDDIGCIANKTLPFVGMHNGKNYYADAGFGISLYWSIANSRWELDGASATPGSNAFIVWVNPTDSAPNPPDMTLGTWTDVSGFCGNLLQLDGSGTQSSVGGCVDPDVPTVSFTPASICEGNSASLSWTGSLGDATNWHIYSGSCGTGTLVGITAGSSFVVTPSGSSTEYFVRGEGGCATPGACGSTTITLATGKPRLVSVDPNSGHITMENCDPNCSVDVTNWQLCSGFSYTLVNSLTVVSGSLNILPGASVTVAWSTVTMGNRDLGLYVPGGSFSNPAAMEDFTQWGSAGNGRESVAVAKGIWDAGTFLLSSSSYTRSDCNANKLAAWSGAAVATVAAGCTSYPQTGVSGNNWVHFTDGSGNVVASINPNNVDLGDVTIEMDDRATVGQDNKGVYYLPRLFNFESTNYNGSGSTFPSAVRIRLFHKMVELDDYNTAAGSALVINDIVMSHYSGGNEDCDVTNNDDPTVATVVDITPLAGTYNNIDFYLEFDVSHFSEIASGGGGLFLPVELSSFSGRALKNANELVWSSASESEFSHYEIQRSQNSVDFRTIGEVGGKGNTADVSVYSYTDRGFVGARNYYRLKMVDLDETFEYSSVIFLESVSKGNIRIYPNPGKDVIQLQFNAEVDGLMFYTVTSIDGQKVMEGRIDNHNYDLDIEPLTKGIYILNVNGNGINETIKLVKE